jgi:hypothetical protein
MIPVVPSHPTPPPHPLSPTGTRQACLLYRYIPGETVKTRDTNQLAYPAPDVTTRHLLITPRSLLTSTFRVGFLNVQMTVVLKHVGNCLRVTDNVPSSE